MKLRSLLVIPICAQMGWSALTLTFKDPKNNPIAGVSCVNGKDTVTSDVQGVLTFTKPLGILRPVQGPKNAPLFHLPIANGEKASVTVFDSRGQRVASRDVRLGESFDFASATPGVFHIRVQGRDLSISQSVVTMGQGMSFTGVSRDASVGSGNLLGKVGDGVAPVVCSKTGYATKTFMLNDDDKKVIGFGAPIGRNFDPSAYPKYTGYNLEVVEDFTTAQWPNGLKWDANKVSNDVVWEPSDAGFPTNGARFHPDQILFKGDAMVLRIDSLEPQVASFSRSEGDNCFDVPTNPKFCGPNNIYGGAKFAPPVNLKGGEVRTKENNYRFGRYEVTIDPPDRGTEVGSAEGFIAAIFTWFTPRDLHWREIDVEIPGNQTASGFLTNIFFANKVPDWHDYIASDLNPTIVPAPYDSRKKHTYAFEWLPNTVKWYVDGKLVRTYGAGGTTKSGIEVSQLSSKVVMNFWVMKGGAVGGQGAGNKYPIETKFDDFRYYRWDEDGDKVKYPEVACIKPGVLNCKNL